MQRASLSASSRSLFLRTITHPYLSWVPSSARTGGVGASRPHSSLVHGCVRSSAAYPEILLRSTRPHYRHSPIRAFVTATPTHNPESASLSSAENQGEKETPEEPRLSLTFTCAAPIPSSSSALPPPGDLTEASTAGADVSSPTSACNHRSTHTFTKRAYQHGIVIIACPSCSSRHLIADNLGWFKNQDGSEGGRTVEDFVRAQGQQVTRGKVVQGAGGSVEVFVE